MTSYWGIRTSKGKWDLINEQFSAGILRQGWGDVDLRDIGRMVEAGDADDEQIKTWRYTKKMLDIQPGDIVVTPHQPNWGQNGVWRVGSGYEFDPLPDIWDGDPDFGHVLRVEQIGLIDHRAASVSSDLRRALTTGFRPRMRQLDAYADEIDELSANVTALEPSDAAEHFAEVRAGARKALGEAIRRQYKDADFERPIEALLNVLYPGSVTRTAGPAEKGRDFVVEDTDALGLSRNVIVQVKAWFDEVDADALDHGLHQLARGIEEQGGNVDLAVLMTLASTLPVDIDERLLAAQEETAVPTHVLGHDEVLNLLLDHLGAMRL
jgi:hypothetical protein